MSKCGDLRGSYWGGGSCEEFFYSGIHNDSSYLRGEVYCNVAIRVYYDDEIRVTWAAISDYVCPSENHMRKEDEMVETDK